MNNKVIERMKFMKSRNIIYIIIAIICVIAIVAGVYYQIFGDKEGETTTNKVDNNVIDTNTVDQNKVDDPEEIKEEFNDLFNNSFDNQGYSTDSVEKIDGLEDKDIVYAAYNIKEEKDNKYSVNINIPVFNVKGDAPATFNNTTQSIFANKANEVLSNSGEYTVFDVEYVAYLNENILSLVIKSILKEGSSAQRTIVQTYNYNIETGKKVTLNEILENKGINTKEVNKKIEEQIVEANKQAEAISQAVGHTVYKRDINNAMYVTDNVTHFFIGLDGQIYIVYPYGNSNFTSEMDIIKVD